MDKELANTMIDRLNENIQNFKQRISQVEPLLFDLNNKEHVEKMEKLFSEGEIKHVVDDFEEQLQELYAVDNPTKVFSKDFKSGFDFYYKTLHEKKTQEKYGIWVFYPWLSLLSHILNEDEFQKVRTARNRNLINEKEQKQYYNATVGIAGLSVGNNVAMSLVLQGGAKNIKLADFDRLALSNTNRVRAGVQNLGLKKVVLTARQIYEINPYAKVEIYPEGLTKENIENFFVGDNPLKVIVDEVDNIAIKLLIRNYAKKFKIPVVMGADNGDNAVIDVERYDERKQPDLFHNRIPALSYEALKNMDKMSVGRTIVKHIGLKNLTNRVLDSLSEIGRTIVSWPQLGGAAILNGVAVAYCVRKILTGQKIINDRALISLDRLLSREVDTKKERSKSLSKIKGFLLPKT